MSHCADAVEAILQSQLIIEGTIIVSACVQLKLRTLYQWPFQDPKNGGTVPYKPIFCGDIPLHRPCIGLTYGTYLQFRFLKFPLIIGLQWSPYTYIHIYIYMHIYKYIQLYQYDTCIHIYIYIHTYTFSVCVCIMQAN